MSQPPSAADNIAPVVCAGLVVADHVCPPLDHLPKAGELVTVDELVLNIGGGAANTAVDLARLGVTARDLRRVGDDVFGRFAIEALRALQIDTETVTVDRVRPTSQTLIVNVRGQDRRFIHCVGANTGFTAADLDAVLEVPPRVSAHRLFLDPCPASRLARWPSDSLAPARPARSRSSTWPLPGPATTSIGSRSCCPIPTYSCPTPTRLDLILGESDPIRQARAFRDLGARRVVITRGQLGVVSVSESMCVNIGTYPACFVDGSGGGDAFNAGYIVGLLEGRSELDCLRLASAVGASCVRTVGTTAGVFTRAEAEEFIGRHHLAVEPIG